MSETGVRVTYGVALVLALVGAGFRIVPARLPVATIPPREPYHVPEQPSGTEQAATLLSFGDIVTENLFAADRTAAETRYTPPELAVAVNASDPTPTPRNAAPRLRLFGTAVAPQGSVALIDADPAIPGAEVYRVGDRIGSARIIEIRETAVVLEGASGRFTLSLPTSVRRLP